MEGPKSLEAVADVGWTKGTAVQMILQHLHVDEALVLYAGDGANDVEAMEEVVRRRGIAVGVGPQAPAAAQYYLHGPEELQSLLANLMRFSLRLRKKTQRPFRTRWRLTVGGCRCFRAGRSKPPPDTVCRIDT